MSSRGEEFDESNFQLDLPDWYRAISFSERLKLLSIDKKDAPSMVNRELALRRLESWKHEKVFGGDSTRFAERLASNGLSEDDLYSLLVEPPENIREHFTEPPEWLRSLSDSFSSSSFQYERIFSKDYAEEDSELGFLRLAQPLMRRGYQRLKNYVHERNGVNSPLPNPEEVVDVLFVKLSEQLLPLIHRTMALELNIDRLKGLLEGDTPHDRFRSFINSLRREDKVLGILREYPVLARQLVICVDQWVNTSAELIDRLCEDWKDLERKFCPDGDLGKLIEIDGEAGDRHREGRSVKILTFSSGVKVVYKPRSLSVDEHFQELLDWLNHRGVTPRFRTLKVINKETYGWVEFIEARGCTSVEQVRRFYRRQGSYLAVLYILNAVDLYSQNLIASGEHPILVDTEALFHHRGAVPETGEAAGNVAEVLDRSVLSTGLLPSRVHSNSQQEEGIDISGLGGEAGQVSPYSIPYWENPATDQMRLSRKRMELSGEKNRPALNGGETNASGYAEDIVSGFTDTYRLLMSLRDELISESGPIERFAHDEVRYVARPTIMYGTLLEESFHPDLLRDSLRRERFFDQLWVSEDDDPKLSQLVQSEREDLHRGDIPIFTNLPRSCDIWDGLNRRIVGYFEEPAIKAVHAKVQDLSLQDLERQVWMIHASFTAWTLNVGLPDWTQDSEWRVPEQQASRAQLLSAACQIGDRLAELALHENEGLSWIGLTQSSGHAWSIGSLGGDLYGGLPGVSLFLAYLGQVTGEEFYTNFAKRALDTVRGRWARAFRDLQSTTLDTQLLEEMQTAIGAYSTLTGTIYTYTHLGTLWNQPELLYDAEDLANLTSQLVERDTKFDIMSGVAGCIPALLGLYYRRPSNELLKIAIRCGEHLVLSAQPVERGVGWPAPLGGEKPLAGFSHGAAGIAYALLQLASVSGREEFRGTALRALEYERHLFSPSAQNWPDLRNPVSSTLPLEPDSDYKPAFMVAWCHGATGIGLSRLQSMQYLDDPKLETEVGAALDTTLKSGFGHNHSLCHGALGNLELPLEVSRVFSDKQLRSEVNKIALGILESGGRHGWLCGVPLGVETPGLMNGLAGIGYGLLRLADPDSIPSMLTLSSP